MKLRRREDFNSDEIVATILPGIGSIVGFTDAIPDPLTERPGVSGTKTCPAGYNRCRIRLVGAGGGGAWRNATTTLGRGGGGGGYCEIVVTVAPGDQINYVQGFGGAASLSAGVDASAGGLSRVGNITATGGFTGVALVANGGGAGTVASGAGAGGTATGGSTNTTGTAGFGPDGGSGAGPYGGAGGAGYNASDPSGPFAGSAYGGGGGGGNNDSSGGRDGYDGLVEFYWYTV